MGPYAGFAHLPAALQAMGCQRADAAPSICRWCTYVGAAACLELCSCLHATVLFIQCVLFLVDSCQMATNLPRLARRELLVWTTVPAAGSLQIRKGVPTLSSVEQEPKPVLRGTARDGKEALVASPTRAQQSEPYATL